MVVLKSKPKDFIVVEKYDDSIFSDEPTSFLAFELKKNNYTTERAVSHIAKHLHVPRKNISYAGTKDKNAITTQLISIFGVNKEKVESINLDDITLTFKGYVSRRLSLGDLKGNSFTIIIRDVPSDFTLPFTSKEVVYFPNYFDKQRFSSNNVRIGKAIIKKEFDDACDIICQSDNDWSQKISSYLDDHMNDFVGALRLLPSKTLLFYVHALQSYYFNMFLGNYIESNYARYMTLSFDFGDLVFPLDIDSISRSDISFPLFGYDSELSEEQVNLLSDDDISIIDCINRQLPELSLEGSMRKAFSSAENISLFKETSQEKTTITASFFLPKGAYATILLKTIFPELFSAS
ncbi:MAG: tRNA pseudouridine(13) synthase TruD [Nanobdellota archaeon]